MTALTKIWDFIDSRQIVRRTVLFIILWLTWESFRWAATFASTTTLDGLGSAAVIGAVTGPIAALQGWVITEYAKGRT